MSHRAPGYRFQYQVPPDVAGRVEPPGREAQLPETVQEVQAGETGAHHDDVHVGWTAVGPVAYGHRASPFSGGSFLIRAYGWLIKA